MFAAGIPEDTREEDDVTTLRHIRQGLLALTTAVALALSLMAGTANAAPAKVFLAVGDSVDGGFGNPLTDNPTPTDIACGRSKLAYPVLVAAAKGATLRNLPCAGAGTRNGMVFGQRREDGTVVQPSQLLQAAQGPRPDAVLLTVGANDLDWGGQLQLCMRHLCNTDANTDEVKGRIQKMEQGLVVVLGGIAALKPRVVLAEEYYDPFGASDAVAAAFGLGPAEIVWYRARLKEQNDAIAEAVRVVACSPFFRGVAFKVVPVTLDPAEIFLNRTDFGIFHPNPAGQEVIAQRNLELVG